MVTDSDAFGGAAVTTVFLPVVTVFGTGTGDVTVGVNTATAILSGISGYNYTVQRATNIDFTSGIVSNFAAQTAPANGQITEVDDFADLFGTPNSGTPATAYYRMRYNP